MATPKRNKKGQFVKSTKTASRPKKRHSNPAPPPKHHTAPARASKPRSSGARKNSPTVIYMAEEKTRKRTKKRHRNPYGGIGIDLVQIGTTSVAQATGAIASEAFMHFAPLPAAWKTGPLSVAVQAGAGIVGAIIGQKIGPKTAQWRKFTQNFAEGAVAYALVGGMVKTFPHLAQQAGLGYTTASNVLYDMGQVRELGQVRDDNMGAIEYADGLAYGEMGRATQYQSYS